ncbi:hypothetical protein DFP72DRAFT_797889 [Ephemerocybe angulata]|uniref:Uncharacterized protein n=1 Tax=Ephemerocybe angulata TaxID=980116 RepID=A0A8H6IH99_9AGAR|nr:hypothetical protein DFP72DRAFT_797889 [Tulosesus angulatus]
MGDVRISVEGTCTPEEYAQGQWVRRPYWTRPGPLSRTNASDQSYYDLLHGAHGPEKMAAKEDILKFARLEGCASGGEYIWNQLAASKEEQWDRFPKALDWEWVPGGRCTGGGGFREWVVEDVLRDLVEGGGWLLVGDSITGNHFFSISCLLYPHVVWRKEDSKERDALQSLYLNASSPLASGFQYPADFNVTTTPLISFKRVDLLWSIEDLVEMHRKHHPEFYVKNETFKLFGSEPVWTISPDAYLDIFLGPAATANYKAMVVSTAGHWTTNLFRGYHKTSGSDLAPAAASPSSPSESFEDVEPLLGYDGLLVFFKEVMVRWAKAVQLRLDAHASLESTAESAPQRQVLVRAYMAGHADCHKQREPFTEVKPVVNMWNWSEFWRYNRIWTDLLSPSTGSKPRPYENVHFLDLDRPGALRPDGHVAADCLHIMTGSGVLEGWTHYIWHYVTKQIH